MKKHKTLILILLIMLIGSFISYPYLPDSIPAHWNGAGEIDEWMGRWFIFFPIILTVLCGGLFELLKRIDPKRSNFQRFIKSYERFQIMITLFLFCLWCITLVAGFQPHLVNIKTILSCLIGCLFIYLGNIMPKIKSNYTFGIRTPWTLASDAVWYRTHRFAGRIWFYGGFLFLLNLVLPASFTMLFLICWGALLGVIPCLYSYLIYRNL